MYLTFYGGAREVTGSCYYLESGGKKLLVDCGLKQGLDEGEDQKIPFDAKDIDFVVLTHAHIDHSGRLPLLIKEGFKGKIYAVKATCDLISILLRDSAKIQENDADWENKRNRRAGKDMAQPLYTLDDVETTLKNLAPCNYEEKITLSDSINIDFIDAGHILGSASVEIFLKEGHLNKKIVFSGDIGNINQPIVKDPQYIKDADYVVMESTYGNKNHEKNKDYLKEFASIIEETLIRGGNVIIPSFAVGRTQALIYFLREIKEKKMIASVADFDVYVDSPLATAATKIYENILKIYADIPTMGIMNRGLRPLSFKNLTFVDSPDDSKALNYDNTPKVIISSSGMCEAGRIKHHLKHNLWKKESSIIFVGFQAIKTLGRTILDGAKKVTIFGDDIAVLADVHNFTGLSSHADKDGLLKWISSFNIKPEKVFIIHGEDSVSEEFAEALKELDFKAYAPYYGEKYDLSSGELISAGTKESKESYDDEKRAIISSAYIELFKTGKKLDEIIASLKGAKDKDLKGLANDIEKLVNNWQQLKH